MKKTTTMFAILLACVMSFFGGCQSDDDVPASEMTKEQVLQEVMPVLQGFLNAQYDYIIGKDTDPQWDQYTTNSTGSAELQTQIDEMKENNYSYDKTTFTDYQSTFKTDERTSLSSSGNMWRISHLVDQYGLTQKSEYSPNDPVTSEGGVNYDFVVIKENGEWKILLWKEDLPWFLGDRRWWYPKLDPYIPAVQSTSVEDPSLRATAAVSYNRTAAKNYALAYVYSPNTNYPNYTNNGGDCTNFVSQCLEAGGWTQVNNGGRSSTSSWYHKRGSSMPALADRSTSWTEAKSLYAFFNANPSRVIPASYPLSSYEIGDVVQIVDNNGVAGHTTIITSKSGGKLYVTFRNAVGYDPDKDVDVSRFVNAKKYWKLANSFGSLLT